jgi:hypothetical protein
MSQNNLQIRRLYSEENLRKFVESLSSSELVEFFLTLATMNQKIDREEKISLIPAWYYDKFNEIFGYYPRKAPLGTIRMLAFNVGKFLQNHPEYITTELYNALSGLKDFYWVVRHFQIDSKTGAIVPTQRKLRDAKTLNVIKGLDLLKRVEEKIGFMLDLMTPQYLRKIAKEHPATFFSALKSMYSGYHILSLDYKPDEKMIESLKIIEQDKDNPERKKEFLLKYVRRNNLK